MSARRRWGAAAVAVAAGVCAVGAAAPAHADTQATRHASFGVWRYAVGTTLSDSSASATLPTTITWRQPTAPGISEQLAYYDDSAGGHDEDTHYPEPGERYASFTTDVPVTGSATFVLQTVYVRDVVTDRVQRTSRLLQQGAFTRTGGWQARADAAASGGSAVVSTRAGASATVRVTGSSFALVTALGPQYGAADVYVDGRKVGTLDGHSATRTDRVVGFQRQWASAGEHTVRVVARTGAPVVVDAAVVNR